MAYLLKAGSGIALFAGGVILFNLKLLELLETGTCASGNVPYEITRECPQGTGGDIALLSAAFPIGLVGCALFAFRGNPPWGERSIKTPLGGFAYGMFAWGIFFTATGAVALISSLTDESFGPDAELGGTIVGITFLVMGVPALVITVWGLVKRLRQRERPATSAPGLG